MKKTIFILILSLFSFILPNQWIDINSSEEEAPSINIVSSEIENTIVEFNLSGFNQKSVYINDDEYWSKAASGFNCIWVDDSHSVFFYFSKCRALLKKLMILQKKLMVLQKS